MAIVLTSSNLNFRGDFGRFETDVSSWNLPHLFPNFEIARVNEAYEGVFCYGIVPKFYYDQDPGEYKALDVSINNISGNRTINVIVTCRIKIFDGSTPVMRTGCELYLDTIGGSWSIEEQDVILSQNLSDSTWAELTAQFTIDASAISSVPFRVGLYISNDSNFPFLFLDSAEIEVDKFEIYEYEEEEEEPDPEPITFNDAYHHLNPILFQRNETANSAEDNYRITCSVEAELVAGSGVFSEVLLIDHTPDDEGKTTFNLRQAFRGLMNPQPPSENLTGITKVTDCRVFAKNVYGDLYDNLTDPVNTVESNNYMVIWGGLEKKDYPDIDFFGSYLDQGPSTKIKFLTHAPSTREMDKNQEGYVNFYCTDSDITKARIKGIIYYDDGTSDGAQDLTAFFTVQKGDILRIPIGPQNSGVKDIDPTKNISRYTVYLYMQNVDGEISRSTDVITITIAPIKPISTRYFLFLNSLGSYEVLRTIGKGEKMAEISKTIIQKYLPPNHSADYGDFDVHEASNQRSEDRSSGYYESQPFMDWLQDFAMSRKVYEITNGDRKPVIIQDAKISVTKDNDYKYFMRFTVQEVYQNPVFSPDAL